MTRVEQTYIVEQASKKIERIARKDLDRRFVPDDVEAAMQDAAHASPALYEEYRAMSERSFNRLFDRVTKRVGLHFEIV
jgi:hypothetical protein